MIAKLMYGYWVDIWSLVLCMMIGKLMYSLCFMFDDRENVVWIGLMYDDLEIDLWSLVDVC